MKTWPAIAYTASGVDLNRAGHSSDYDPLGSYIVVYWNPDRSSIIKMEGGFLVPNYDPAPGIDQDGNPWEISLAAADGCH